METKNHKSVLSVDVEDSINVAYLKFFNEEIRPTNRVVYNTEKLLELFSKHNVKTTFFVLGEVAEDYPYLIKKIDKEGHEVGIHGYVHRHLEKADQEKNKAEIKKTKIIIENIIGSPVYGYRAPYLSLNKDNSWVIEYLAELGLYYDTSVADNFLDLNFKTKQKSFYSEIALNKRTFIEIPPSTKKIIHKRIPIFSGNYLRLFPFFLIKRLFRQNIKKQPIIMYVHPYEIDYSPVPNYLDLKLKQTSFKNKLMIKLNRHNRNKLYERLDYLLSNFQFTTMIDLIKESKINDFTDKKIPKPLNVLNDHIQY